jgi:hypothetical protein
VQTMTSATAEERRLLANIAQHGEPVELKPEAKPTAEEAPVTVFADAVAAFMRTTAITELKPSSRIGYAEVFRTRLLPALGQMPIKAGITGFRSTTSGASSSRSCSGREDRRPPCSSSPATCT